MTRFVGCERNAVTIVSDTNDMAGFSKKKSGLLKASALAALLLLAVAVIYGRTLDYPFVQDDWFCLSQSARQVGLESFQETLFPQDTVFFRPLGNLCFYLSWHLFGTSATWFRAFLLSLHWMNGLLAVYLAFRMTGLAGIAWVAGFLYVAAVSIHMDPLLWAVGIYYTGGAFFLFLSLALFLQGRSLLSSGAFLGALLFQEGTLFAPVLLGVMLFCRQRPGVPERTKALLSALWPHLIIATVYCAAKLPISLLVSLPARNPYKIAWFGPHIARNVFAYFAWAVEGVLPVNGLQIGAQSPDLPPAQAGAGMLFLAGFVATGVVIALAVLHRRKTAPQAVLLSAAWFVLSLVPVVFFVNHTYRYYLTYGLLPFIVLFLLASRRAVCVLGLGRRMAAVTACLYVSALVVAAAVFFLKADAEGLQHRYMGGDNNLIRKVHAVRAVQQGLFQSHPTLPEGAVLVFDDMDLLWAIGFWAGPRLWYGDKSLTVAYARAIRRDAVGMYIEHVGWIRDRYASRQAGNLPSRVYLDPQKTFFFRLRRDGRLQELEATPLSLRTGTSFFQSGAGCPCHLAAGDGLFCFPAGCLLQS